MSEELNEKALARAKAAGVEDRVTLLQSDFMDTDVFATLCDLRSRLKNALDRPGEDLLKIDGAPFVIAMYLLPDALYRLHPSIEWCVEISCSFYLWWVYFPSEFRVRSSATPAAGAAFVSLL